MKKVHYIDVDEEITSVIDRLRQSKSLENYFIVPRRALILQSVVSLKLLRKEAEKNRKKVIIVTQSQTGQAFAQKAELEVLSTIEGLSLEKDQGSEKVFAGGGIEKFSDEEELSQESEENKEKIAKKNRLENLGSSDFFESKDSVLLEKTAPVPKPQTLNSVAAELSSANAKKSLRSARMNDMLPENKPKKAFLESDFRAYVKSAATEQTAPEDNLDYQYQKDKRIESIFKKPEESLNSQDEKEDKTSIKESQKIPHSFGRKLKIAFSIFLVIALIFIAGVYTIFYLPEAKITLTPGTGEKVADLEVKAQVGAESNLGDCCQAEIIEEESEMFFSYPATGRTGSVNQKARGKVVIYNEFGPNPQTLVVKTRLLSQEGKLFRLSKNIVVPGMTSVGEEKKPGAVEAEVIADEVGEDYNIGPSRFTIPGFEGGPKYEKFYARSEKAMTGGVSTNQGAKVVTSGDLEKAKKEAEVKAKKDFEKKMEEKAALRGLKLINESLSSEIIRVEIQSKAGDIRDNFDCKVLIKAQAFSLNESQIREELLKKMEKEAGPKLEIETDSLRLNYRQSQADFEKKTIIVKVNGSANFSAYLDKEKLKSEILGKDENQIREWARNYPEIKAINMQLWPSFIFKIFKKIPTKSENVELEVVSDWDSDSQKEN